MRSRPFLFMKYPLILLMRTLKNETVSDFFIALARSIFVGFPLFTLHMLVLDYEHSLHGMNLQFSFEMSLKTCSLIIMQRFNAAGQAFEADETKEFEYEEISASFRTYGGCVHK